METSQSVPLDLVQVIQALVVLFIAAPPLVRTLIGLRHIDQPGAEARLSRAQRRKAAAATEIGRASCRESVENDEGSIKDKKATVVKYDSHYVIDHKSTC